MTTKKRGFASMEPQKQQAIAKKGAETRKRNAKSSTSKGKEK